MGDIKNEACFIFACFFSYEGFLHRTNLDMTVCSIFLLCCPPGRDLHQAVISFAVPAHWAHQFSQLTF